MNKRWVRLLFGRRVLFCLMLLIQAAFVIFMLLSGLRQYELLSIALRLLSLTASFYIVSRGDRTAYKVTWIIFIMTLPLFGGLLYLSHRLQTSNHSIRGISRHCGDKSRSVLMPDGCGAGTPAGEELNRLEKISPSVMPQAGYLCHTCGFPVWRGTYTEYFPTGEDMFEAMKNELAKAEHFIFLEYFIIEQGVMWGQILDILAEKAAAGVDVRIIYDDIGCFLKLPHDYPKQLEERGIKCRIFNPFVPFWTTIQNNRDHRKIMVIDGHTAFSGGINLADEYINARERFGHWKDNGVMLKGPAVRSFTVMFLAMWQMITGVDEDYTPFLPEEMPVYDDEAGFVQPWSDSPLDQEHVSEHVYMQMINRANRYVYITTPYLIIDENLLTALRLAAKSGIDVRIVTPHIPDKRLVHETTRSYYAPLIEAGVRIYEYFPGFIHSKMIVSDDEAAVIGTVNLDYRSFYLHFECGAWIYRSDTVIDMRRDYEDILENCKEISPESRLCRGSPFQRVKRLFLRLIAPLL